MDYTTIWRATFREESRFLGRTQVAVHTFTCGSPACDRAFPLQGKWSREDTDGPHTLIKSEGLDELHQGNIVYFVNLFITRVPNDYSQIACLYGGGGEKTGYENMQCTKAIPVRIIKVI